MNMAGRMSTVAIVHVVATVITAGDIATAVAAETARACVRPCTVVVMLLLSARLRRAAKLSVAIAGGDQYFYNIDR